MTGFTFDAKAALKVAQARHNPPIRPNRPNGSTSKGEGVGGFGGLGAKRVSYQEIARGEPERETREECATVRKFFENQYRADAEEIDSRMRENAPIISSARADGLDPDAGAYFDRLHLYGPATYGAMAAALRWGATRAWQAEARLRAAGLIHYENGIAAAARHASNTAK
jgi:hypothetical protein